MPRVIGVWLRPRSSTHRGVAMSSAVERVEDPDDVVAPATPTADARQLASAVKPKPSLKGGFAAAIQAEKPALKKKGLLRRAASAFGTTKKPAAPAAPAAPAELDGPAEIRTPSKLIKQASDDEQARQDHEIVM